MRLRLQTLQAKDEQARKTRAEQSEGWDDNPLAGHFGIEKTRELIARKYYWPTLHRDVKDYVRECDVCLASKAVWHKPYSDLQFLPIPIYR